MTTLEKLTPAEFRRQLAGIADERGLNLELYSNDQFREIATELCVALALAFNRSQLEPMTLWKRIDSAVQAGITAANGADVHRLLDAALDHVLASPNAVVTDEFASRVAPLQAMDEDAAYAFCAYLSKAKYTPIILAKQAWDERKELRKLAEQVAQADAAENEVEQ